MDNTLKELIQVAAVAVQAVADLGRQSHTAVLQEVCHEMDRQNKKWGPQTHDAYIWLGILGEEFGEACQAVNQQCSR